MKKKFINGLLLAALFLGFTGSMVSCKDYDDEKVANLEGRLNDELTSLKAQINSLSTSLNECKTTCANFRTLVEKTYLTIAAFNTFKDGLGNTYYTKGEVDQRIADELANCYTTTEIDSLFNKYYTKEELEALYFTKEEMERRFGNYYTTGEIDGFFKDYYTKKEIDKMLENFLTDEAVAKTIAELLDKENEVLTTALNNYFLKDPVVEQYLRDGKGGDIINEHINNALINVNNDISQARSIAKEALDLAKENGGKITTLETNYNTLSNTVTSLSGELNQVRETANAAKAAAEANAILISNLTEAYTEMNERVEDLEDGYAVMLITLAALADQAEADRLAADALHRQMLETISGLVSGVDELQGKIDKALEDIGNNTTAISNLLSKFKNVLAKFITGIEINGTQNPAFGSISLPIDMRSNILMAYYGHLDDYGIQFPTTRPAYYALEDGQVLTDEDVEMIGGLDNKAIKIAGNQDIVSNMASDGTVPSGNAGKLYLTVNPTNRDFTGTEFQIINSRNEVSAIQLSDLTKSNDVLTFGVTRAGVAEQSENGFYEAKATLAPADLAKAERLELDMDAAKDIANKIRNSEGGINVTGILSSVLNGTSLSVAANAVKTTWTDELGTRSVVSQYAIAATAVKPLSYAFAKDVDYNRVPGLGVIEDIADRFVDKMAAKFPEFDKYEINEIVLKDFNPATLSVTVWVTVTKGETTKTEDVTFNLNSIVSIDPGKAVYYDDVVTLMDDLNDFFASFNTISVDALSVKVKNTVSEFLDIVNERFGRYFNPNKFMQPLMLIKANGSFARLSESAKYPAHVNATRLSLLPTSYNAEIIAPAFKKFIAVTNVSKDGVSAKGGDMDCKSVLDEANNQQSINEVIDGGYNGFIGFTGKAGYTYEILYTAVDYTGKVVVKKFYVTFNA